MLLRDPCRELSCHKSIHFDAAREYQLAGGRRALHRLIDHLKKAHQIAFHLDPAVHIGVPEADFRVAQQPRQRAAILNHHGGYGRTARGRNIGASLDDEDEPAPSR